jgi:predicted nucleotidyltransferase
MKADDIIREMVRRIAEGFAPEKIILFGSRAGENPSPDSDVDLLVIVKEAKDPRTLRLAMRRAVNGLGLAKDVVVMSRDDFDVKRRIPGTIAYPADKEGKVLYAR